MDKLLYQRHAEAENTHWWFTARRRILLDQLRALALPEPARILDVGCGAGANLQAMQGLGNAYGIDMSPEAIVWASERCPNRVALGSLPNDIPFPGPYDLITMFDVLEHIEDEQAALHAVREQLKPSGYLVLTVPAYQWLWSGHDVASHHYRRYTRGRLQTALRAASFQVVRSSYMNTLLLPLAVAERLLRGARATDELAPVQPALNRALHAVFASERRLLRAINLPAGLSVIAVAQRGG